jgi:hypothetical protein
MLIQIAKRHEYNNGRYTESHAMSRIIQHGSDWSRVLSPGDGEGDAIRCDMEDLSFQL